MAFDYSKLRGRIVEKFGSVSKFIDAINENGAKMSQKSFYSKINGSSYWKQEEIAFVSEALGISPEEIHLYFFDLKVQNVEL